MIPTRPKTWSSEAASPGTTSAFFVGLLFALAVFALNEFAYQRAQQAFLTLRNIDGASASTQQVLRQLVDAESSQRGYLLTSREDYLSPGASARQNIERALSDLKTRFGSAPGWRPHIDALANRTQERLSALQATLTLHEQGNDESVRDLFLSGVGREKMQAVRTSALALQRLADRQADMESTRVVAALNNGRWGVYATMTLALLWFIYFLRKNAALRREQRLHAHDLHSERERLASEVTARTEELRGLNERLQWLGEDERGRLARLMHDELGAILTAAKLDMVRLRRLVDSQQLAKSLARLDHLAATLDQGIHLKRRIMEDLMPSALHNLGLREALEALADKFSSDKRFAIDLALQEVATSARSRLLAYRWVESALAEVTRHAHASHVRIGLQSTTGDLLQVSLHDDSAVASVLTQPQDDEGVNLRNRIERLGGSVVVRFVPGQGSERVATMPANSDSKFDGGTQEASTPA